RLDDSIATLTDAAAMAKSLEDYETRVVALLLLAPALALAGRLTEAQERFDEVIGLCRDAGDRLHLGAAYANRLLLWGKHNEERAMDDLRHAIEIAREIGNAQLERRVQFNLAELLYWSGSLDEALARVSRSRDLQLRYVEHPGPED